MRFGTQMYDDNAFIRRRNTEIAYGIIACWMVFCTLLAIFNRRLLPAKYFFDAGNIANRFERTKCFMLSDSYDNTARFYDVIGLSSSPLLTALISSAVFCLFLLNCFVMPRVMDSRALFNVSIMAFSAVCGSVYLAQYTKEILVLLCVIAFFVCARSRRLLLFVWCPLALVYAAYFRTYWFLIAALYVYYRIVFKIGRNFWTILLSVVFALGILGMAFHFVLGVDLAYYRYMVNDARSYDVNANTMILPILPRGNGMLEWANAVVQFLLMCFPIPLLSGNLLYLVFFVVIALLTTRLFKVGRDICAAGVQGNPARETRLFALVLAFVTVQSIFEPDYGSYIKHLTPMLPLIVHILCWHQQVWTTVPVKYG